MNSAVYPKFNAYLSHIWSGYKNKRIYKHVYTIQENMHAYIVNGSTYWYSTEKRIGSLWLNPIGNVWLKPIGSIWLKAFWLCMVNLVYS